MRVHVFYVDISWLDSGSIFFLQKLDFSLAFDDWVHFAIFMFFEFLFDFRFDLLEYFDLPIVVVILFLFFSIDIFCQTTVRGEIAGDEGRVDLRGVRDHLIDFLSYLVSFDTFFWWLVFDETADSHGGRLILIQFYVDELGLSSMDIEWWHFFMILKMGMIGDDLFLWLLG